MTAWLMAQRKILKRWRRRYKGMKILQKVFKILIALTNIGLSAWQFYEKFLKERLEERKDKKTSS